MREEQVQLEKKAVVYEEVGIGKREVQETQVVSGTVRREEARIDREGDVNVGGSAGSKPCPPIAQKWQQRYGTTGDRWEDAEPGYRYGHDMRSRPEYRGRQWSEVEPEFQRDWTQRNPDKPWDKASRSIRESGKTPRIASANQAGCGSTRGSRTSPLSTVSGRSSRARVTAGTSVVGGSNSMGLLDSLLGNPQQQQDYQNYVQRYQQGPPQEGYTDQEVVQRYQQVAPQLPPQDYQQAARQAFESHVSTGAHAVRAIRSAASAVAGHPGGRLRARRGAGGVQRRRLSRAAYRSVAPTAAETADAAARWWWNGSGGGMLGSPVAKAALAGIAAMAVSNAMGGGTGGSAMGGLLGGVLGQQSGR